MKVLSMFLATAVSTFMLTGHSLADAAAEKAKNPARARTSVLGSNVCEVSAGTNSSVFLAY